MKYIRKFSTTSDREAYFANQPIPDLPYMHLVESTGEVFFSSPEVDVPLYIKALQNLTVKFGNTYEYSKDNVTWTSATSSTSISANAGERVFFRASGLTASSGSGIGKFTISSGNCNVGGNVMSMVYGADYKGKTEITQAYQFLRLFINATKIVDASGLALPATTLADRCYNQMFYNCTSLVTAPALPATTLASSCYSYMFYGCTSLVTAPALPATTLASSCYSQMFYGCTSLVTAPAALPATTLADRCYCDMFYSCTSLENAPDIKAETLADYKYNGGRYEGCCAYMFYGCTSLVNAPALPATILNSYCYNYMFYGCTSLVNAPALLATSLAGGCYGYMFSGCTSLVNAPALPATTLSSNCYQYMFSGCTSLVNAPELPATTLSSGCYGGMFRNCSNLNYIKAMFTTSPSTSYLSNWVNGVASTGTFVKNSAATWENTFGVSAIPEGWTVETADA